MKNVALYYLFALTLWLTGSAGSVSAQSAGRRDGFDTEEPAANPKLNNRRLEKNLDRFATELNLSKRQEKQLRKIDRRYARFERKLARKDGAKRRDRKMLADEKRNEIIEVLTPEQQQQLVALSKKGRFSLDQLFRK
ncbi:hypothetical protein [Dyadobacter aurulentus]|uniref:hypothetical protein n=1 Tax=Dyadobacter sp. UC 10 TaxID=2605428 RepID=UPI0011F1305E|nr:hypothetical protein [Dyadobacter sp. UC 10]KAA0990928.1 hypothetical protein FXO21_12570 [Dyadobacter sp. UC 10]